MSWWTRFRDEAIDVGTLGAVNPRQSRHQEAEMQQAYNEQMNAYKQQTELTRQEIDRVRAEEDVQKRRIEEKQIRALRRNYSSQGLMQTPAGTPNDMNDKLGG